MNISNKFLSLIVVADENNGIGTKGDQPAYIKDDLKRFKRITSGRTIVMGRKTFAALPKGALPKRRNIVLTRKSDFAAEGVETIHSADELEQICGEHEKIFVIGGGEVYKLFMEKANYIYLTRIHHTFKEIDTWFPAIDEAKWTLESVEGPFETDNASTSFSFLFYSKNF
jgi:dihydrofolate reductase